jgi:hypothetical protein
MKILFLHNNYPAQFGALGRWLAGEGWQVCFLTQKKGAQARGRADGIEVVVYRDREQKEQAPHPFLNGAQKAVVTGASAAEVMTHLRDAKGYRPDVVMAHSG